MARTEVSYVDHMGSDVRAAEAARVSFNSMDFEGEDLSERDARLIAFLARENHTSPFEHSVLSVRIKCPLFVRSQIMRHRTFSYNEVSRRYTSEDIEFFEFDTLRKQAQKNLQCSTGEAVDDSANLQLSITQHLLESLHLYNHLLDSGVAREQARSVLPQSLMTSFIMTGNLLNWIKFLRLRLDEHTQPECKTVADLIREIISDRFEHTASVFKL